MQEFISIIVLIVIMEKAKMVAEKFIAEHNCKDKNIDCGICKPHP
jgi:hypothetical protein